MKKENLTSEEKTKLITFIGEAVLTNATFPSLRQGANNVTIQELLNNRNTDSLRDLGKTIKKKIADYDPEFSKSDNLKIAGFEGERVVEVLKLMIKYHEYNEWRKTALAKASALKDELKSLQTPEERKAAVAQELEELKKLEAELVA